MPNKRRKEKNGVFLSRWYIRILFYSSYSVFPGDFEALVVSISRQNSAGQHNLHIEYTDYAFSTEYSVIRRGSPRNEDGGTCGDCICNGDKKAVDKGEPLPECNSALLQQACYFPSAPYSLFAPFLSSHIFTSTTLDSLPCLMLL